MIYIIYLIIYASKRESKLSDAEINEIQAQARAEAREELRKEIEAEERAKAAAEKKDE